MLTSAAMLSRRAVSLPEPDRNTILLFVSSVLMNGRTYRTGRLVTQMQILACVYRRSVRLAEGLSTMKVLGDSKDYRCLLKRPHHAPHTPEYEGGVQEPQGMQALRIVRLQKLKHCLQGLHIQVPGPQACVALRTISSVNVHCSSA